MSWGDDRRKRDEDRQQRLRKEAKVLLQMINEAVAVELGKEDPEGVHNVVTRADSITIGAAMSSPCTRPPVMEVDGYAVGLKITEHKYESSGGGLGYHYSGRLACSVDWIWINYDIKHKSKSFSYSSKTRQDTFGFDIPKIAKYTLWWIKTKKALEGVAEKRKDALGMWRAAAERVRARFDLPESVKVVGTPGGVKVEFSTDEQRAVAALRAAGHKEKS